MLILLNIFIVVFVLCVISVCVQLSVEARLEITKRAQKALKGISDKSKKKGNDDRSENSASNFDSALTHMQQSLAHLETLSHSFTVSLKTSQEVIFKFTKMYCPLVILSSKTDANSKQSLKCYASIQATCLFPPPPQFLPFLTYEQCL